jgi:RNA polymerase-binding protein DksA
MNVAKFRKRLLEERARVEQQIQKVEALDEGTSQKDELGEVAVYDQHQADVATNTFEREQDQAIDATLRDELKQIDEALQKIEVGSYGICERCKKPIAPARLEALPYATLCIDCAALIGGTTYGGTP